jgi:hypothetical protein
MTAGRFSIGQKVRCVREHFSGDLIVGQTYVVAAPNQDEPTCTWIEGNSYGYFSDHFVAVTDAESVQPADECTCLDQPQWCAFCIRRIEAWQGCPEPETDDQLDSRNVKPNPLIWPTTPQQSAPLTPAQAGIARALRRICDGADYRSGCADYEPER